MPIALKVLNGLRAGGIIIADLPPQMPGRCAFVFIIPVIPDDPELYIFRGEAKPRGPLRDPASITCFYVCRLEHDKKFLNDAEGIYDREDPVAHAFDDSDTRLEFKIVDVETNLEASLQLWLSDLTLLRSPGIADNLRLPLYVVWEIKRAVQHPEEYPHLWKEPVKVYEQNSDKRHGNS